MKIVKVIKTSVKDINQGRIIMSKSWEDYEMLVRHVAQDLANLSEPNVSELQALSPEEKSALQADKFELHDNV